MTQLISLLEQYPWLVKIVKILLFFLIAWLIQRYFGMVCKAIVRTFTLPPRVGS